MPKLPSHHLELGFLPSAPSTCLFPCEQEWNSHWAPIASTRLWGGQSGESDSFFLICPEMALWQSTLPLLFSCSVVSDSLRPHGLQHARIPCPPPSPRVCSDSCPLSWWCHTTISLLFLLSVFPSIRVFSYQVAQVLRFSVLPMNIQGWFPLGLTKDWLVWSPCSPRGSQESFPASQFKSIISLALSLLYGPAVTSIHDYCKNHSFDYTDLCWQSDVSAF